MRIKSQLPKNRTLSDIERLRDKIRTATERGIEPDANCEHCAIARRFAKQILWCKCIADKI